MKRINNSSVNQKDRIVCVTVTGAHKFYYQPSKSTERLYLFTTENFSGSVLRISVITADAWADAASALQLRSSMKTVRCTAIPKSEISSTVCPE